MALLVLSERLLRSVEHRLEHLVHSADSAPHQRLPLLQGLLGRVLPPGLVQELRVDSAQVPALSAKLRLNQADSVLAPPGDLAQQRRVHLVVAPLGVLDRLLQVRLARNPVDLD